MTSADWQQVKEVFEAALERDPEERAAFLAQACARDESIKQEVESLLAAHEKDSGFLNTPVGHLVIGDKPIFTAGQRFGPYEGISPLGEGGMGQVYLAMDTRLGRKVALKLLPSSYTNDPERVHRFGQEARAASALNHPNIVTIHEIGQMNSLHFIATEFIEGETLREHMLTTRMTVGELLDVAAQSKFEGVFFDCAVLCAQLGEKDQAFKYLNKAIEKREWAVTQVKVLPNLDPLRDDTRFDELVARVGLK